MVAIGAFPGRNAGHLIGTDDVSPFDEQLRRLLVEIADDFDLLAKGVGVIGVCIKPVSTPMGLELGLLLKNARHFGLKYPQRCRVFLPQQPVHGESTP